MPKLKRVTMMITDEQDRFLKMMEMAVDIKKSQLVRDFLDDAITNNKRTIDEFLSGGKGK